MKSLDKYHLIRSLMALPFALPVTVPVWRRVSGQGRNWGRILYYHGVPDSSIGSFEAQMRFLSSHYSIVSLEEILNGMKDRPPVGRCVALSFDDGFLDNYRNAFPVLRRLGLPATFFVSTDFIDVSGDADAEARFCTERIGMTAGSPSMSWCQLREMHEAGYPIGSHTLKHARLAGLGDADLIHEVVSSKQRIEDALGAPCAHIAYPFGRWSDVDGRALEVIRRTGYEACFSAVPGFNSPGCAPFVPFRDHVVPSWSPATLRLIVEGGLDIRYRQHRRHLTQLSRTS